MAATIGTSPANTTPKQEGKEKEKGALLCASHQKQNTFPKAPSNQAFPYTSQARLGHVTTLHQYPMKNRVVTINLKQSCSISWDMAAQTTWGSVVLSVCHKPYYVQGWREGQSPNEQSINKQKIRKILSASPELVGGTFRPVSQVTAYPRSHDSGRELNTCHQWGLPWPMA